MKNEVTAFGIYAALRTTKANALSAKGIAEAANIDTTSENLQEIRNELYGARALDGSVVIRKAYGVTWFSMAEAA